MLGLPGRVVRVEGGLAEAECDGASTWCNALMQPVLQVGNHVVTHAGLVAGVIRAEQARELLDLLEEQPEPAG